MRRRRLLLKALPLSSLTSLATHVARNVAAGAEMFQRGKVEKGRCNSPPSLGPILPLLALRCYYVVRRREGVHFLATHDKQITFERLIPRHYSPVSPRPTPHSPSYHPFMGASDTFADQGWNFNEIFSISPPSSPPFCQRSLHPLMEVGIS